MSVDAAYRAMPTHHTPTEFDAKGSSGQSAWAGVMPDAAAAPPTPERFKYIQTVIIRENII